ncbi:hypothetical protein DFQ28_000691 [Apophysomyces sp. BC1034]|nr:hypothetical protein DFQ30_001135 [Apophysomyces sp. BC1015]KAG0167479.1 hypothetical protein DFQ29_000391 [Apophysomyces sp. BC1021]KAG0183874.1 hypothetical protein DFQ28_000691 [Apophysomyces sp. BC1034]
MAWDAGIKFWDTANAYSNGISERIIAKAIKQFNIPRNRLVIATKVFSPVFEDDISIAPVVGAAPDDPRLINNGGLSRKAIFDANTPIKETMEALHDLVKAGKVRYLGASSMRAWQFVRMNAVAEKNGWTQFVTMQDCYNLLYREEEREMALLKFSTPLFNGQLARTPGASTSRSKSDAGKPWLSTITDVETEIINRVNELAQKKGVPMARIALAWILSKPAVTSPIVGASKESHLKDAIDALSMKLTEDEVKYLEEPYIPKNLIHM